jgi:hypothetical protein
MLQRIQRTRRPRSYMDLLIDFINLNYRSFEEWIHLGDYEEYHVISMFLRSIGIQTPHFDCPMLLGWSYLSQISLNIG